MILTGMVEMLVTKMMEYFSWKLVLQIDNIRGAANPEKSADMQHYVWNSVFGARLTPFVRVGLEAIFQV